MTQRGLGRRRALLLLLPLLVALLLAGLSPAQAERRHTTRHPPAVSPKAVFGAMPLISDRSFADPSAIAWAGGYVAVGTGPDGLRSTAPTIAGPWTDAAPALAYLPSWAIADRAWASDIDEIDGTWLLYFSVEAAGLPAEGRCIGVATAPDPTQPFVPDDRPLVCPKAAVAPKAYDRLKHHPEGIPINGVIDPDLFRDKRGHYYLLYRTQAFPASIRIVPLPSSGRPEGTTVRSQELVRSTNAVENPTMLRRKGQYLLFTSEGYFGGCSYTTTWRRSNHLLDWSGSTPKALLDSTKTGLCGPGGADFAGRDQELPGDGVPRLDLPRPRRVDVPRRARLRPVAQVPRDQEHVCRDAALHAPPGAADRGLRDPGATRALTGRARSGR